MLGIALKKTAAELGLTVGHGVAYGVYRGYMLTLQEGAGWKSVSIAASFPDANAQETVRSALAEALPPKAYRIRELKLGKKNLTAVFLDNPGTLPRLKEALGILLQQLTDAGIPGAALCSHCGNPLSSYGGKAVLIAGNVYCMHDSCVASVTNEISEDSEQIKSEGSALSGTVGAVLGALVGAIPWAVAYYFGWFVGWFGFLIGIAAKKGYEILHGKETRVKGVVILVVVFLSVLLAEYATLLLSWVMEVNADSELSAYGLTVRDIAQVMNQTILTVPEMRRSVISNVLLGWLFAGLGVFSTMKQIFGNANALHSKPVVLSPLQNDAP